MMKCQIKAASTFCGCTPWNYPHIGKSRVCDTYGHKCFEKVFTNTKKMKTKCDCPLDCNVDKYSYSVSSTALNTVCFVAGVCRQGLIWATANLVPHFNP